MQGERCAKFPGHGGMNGKKIAPIRACTVIITPMILSTLQEDTQAELLCDSQSLGFNKV